MWSIALCLLVTFAESQLTGPAPPHSVDCSKAPPAQRLYCEQIQRWDTEARKAAAGPQAPPAPGPPGIPTGNAFVAPRTPSASTLVECLNLQCVCQFLRGSLTNVGCILPNGQALGRAVRKEYRTLTDAERNKFHNALTILKISGAYDALARLYAQRQVSLGAHGGPAFLPWHREYIKRFELMLRSVDPTIALPYWDSTIDNELIRPVDSVLFSNLFMGYTNSSHSVTDGILKTWPTFEGRPHVQRQIGNDGTLLNDQNVDWVLRQTEASQVLAYGCPFRVDPNNLELSSGNVHLFIGGDMAEPTTATNDPLFFLHYAFVDFIWEQWRQSRQSRQERETSFPQDNQVCASTQHSRNALMLPFSGFTNRDGLLNSYTDSLYSYAPRPTCPSCGGWPYLFCDNSKGRPKCVAKVRPGGTCKGFVNPAAVCYASTCQPLGICA